MIFNLSTAFIKGAKPNLLSDLVAEIIKHEHYLTISGDAVDYLWGVLDKNSSSTQIDLLLRYQGFTPSVEVKSFLTTISDVDYSFDDLFSLASKPAIVLMENTREWDVYKSMMTEFSADADYGNLFKLLQQAAADTLASRLVPRQAGGYAEIPNCLQSISMAERYNAMVKRKVYVIMDRDTSSYVYPLPEDKKNVFSYLCGKNHLSVTESDIYSLSQQDYIWHMWYRRSIENYFPDAAFASIGRTRNAYKPPFENDYYAKVEDYYADGRVVKKRDLKNDLGRLASYMTKSLYEVNLHSFSIGGKSINEIQLFLLKMVRVI